MAPHEEYTVVRALSTQVLSYDKAAVIVEAGAYTPMQWFLQHGLKPTSTDLHESDDSDGQPPAKKRRMKDKGCRKAVSVRAKPLDEESYIPLSRIIIDLHFPDSHTPLHLEGFKNDVKVSREESVRVSPAIIDHPEQGHRLMLSLKKEKGEVIMVDVANLQGSALAALRQHTTMPVNNTKTMRTHAVVGRRNATVKSERQATLSECTLSASNGKLYKVVRLEATFYWRSGVSAFPYGTPTGVTKVYPDYEFLTQSFPDGKRDEADHTQDWVPRDFYQAVHVLPKSKNVASDFEGILESDLYPFQKRAVHWMLEREGVEYENGQMSKIPRSRQEQDLSLFEPVKDLSGKTCFVSHLLGMIQRRDPAEMDNGLTTRRLSGGLLAEEMGLGKTVELMTLLKIHSRPEIMHTKLWDAASKTNIRPSSATLIITPASILDQWKTEFANHAPATKVLVYKGVAASKSAKEETPSLVDLAEKYDVVLATYHTLAREVHFAEDPPERNMRHARKFERKSSPLVEIQWWRVCLDEAQMIESGVTAAARVACRIPRVHSWAVSGTPLRKDVQDLHGLLVFLRFEPLNENAKLWSHMITNHKHLARDIFGSIAIRQTKAQIRDELILPPQKRIVANLPFTAVEEQHYSTLFSEMCEAVRVNADGSPKDDDWDPEDSVVVEAMRSFLNRLRQTCLHPQVGAKKGKAHARGQGPLRTVAEVLEVMIDQKETSIRSEERLLLAAQLIKAHIVGNAGDDTLRSEKALKIYSEAMETSKKFVEDARERLAAAKVMQDAMNVDDGDGDGDDSGSEATPLLGQLRNNLRTSLQLQHTCFFFAATAYFQIKSNETLTPPDSDRFKELEEKEVQLYESAKLIRKEILSDNSRKAENMMRKIQDLRDKDEWIKLPNIKDLKSLGGIESRRIVEKSDILFDLLREQAQLLVQWRTKMAEYLLKPLVDEDKTGVETTGDEYEDSTKVQDELYAYFDACKCVQADVNTVVTGEAAPLIDHEAKMLTRHAKNLLDENIVADVKVAVHAPELSLELLTLRNKLRKEQDDAGSIRGLIQETRGLETSLQGFETGTRGAERAIVRQHLSALQAVFSSYTKVLDKLEKEIDMFRSAQNQKLQFYRQLQEVSDTVQPYKEELDETLDLVALNHAVAKEEELSKSLAVFKTQNRYLFSLRDEAGTQKGPKICVICQFAFENGVLTVCGHQFCKECIQHWWNQAKNCPVCKRKLGTVDFHNITYKPKELQAHEEVQSGSSSSEDEMDISPSQTQKSSQTSIYSGIDTEMLHEINSIDLPVSYGTKIDMLGRHLHWLRSHDPGAKSIVFSQYRPFLDVLGIALRDFKIGCVRLGRHGAVEKFKHDPSIDCLLLDAKTDSSGLTLVNATHVVLCEPLIQTAVELQAIARVHRIGQTRPTTVWMYLVNDTVEESIYQISVTRRLEHVQARQSARSVQKSRSATPAPPAQLQENAIDQANTEQLQSAPLSKLLVAGKTGGEMVGNGDLWQCLFGKPRKEEQSAAVDSMEVEMVVGRHLRAEAAEGRARVQVV